MTDRTMVKIIVNENSFALKTKSRKFHAPHNFYILKNELRRLEKQGHLITNDIHSFAELYLRKTADIPELLQIKFSWLSENWNGTLMGHRESVNLPYDYFHEPVDGSVIAEGTTWNVLSLQTQNKPQIEFHSRKNLKQVSEISLLRGKLGRFLDRHFNWVDYQRIVITDDFEPYSFMFSGYTQYGIGVCGGIILHGQEDVSTANYSLHT